MAKGFFTKEEIDSVSIEKPVIVKREHTFVGSCKICKLYKSCNSPKMTVQGQGKKGILIVAEYPTKEEDASGEPFSGHSGKIFKDILNDLGLELEDDFWYTYAVRCKPIKIDQVKPVNVISCRRFLLKAIEELKPKAIITLGKTAMDGLVGQRMTGRLSNIANQDWIGSQIPDQELKVRIFPTWNPKVLFYKDNEDRIDIVIRNQITEHIKMAVQVVDRNTPFLVSSYEGECITIYDSLEAIKIINKMKKAKIIAFDYETTGIKPYREGQEIYSVSVSDGAFSYGMPYFNDEAFRTAWLELMQSNVPKIAHNAKFEMMWTKVRGGFNNTEGCWPNNVFWDTMLCAHSLYNKKKTNLKYKVYTLFGVAGYDNAIDPYLSASKEDEEKWGTNAFNRIREAPLDEVLKYNAMDSIYTYKLYEHQNRRLSPHLMEGFRLEMNGIVALTQAEYNGLICNEKDLQKSKSIMTKRMDLLGEEIWKSKEIKKFSKKDAMGRPVKFSLTNPHHLSYLVFNDLGYETEKKTATGKNKADKEVFSTYNIDVVDNILEWKRWSKARDTYVASFEREITNSVIHPFFHLHIVPSFRSSSSHVNFQNIPKRDEKVADLIRRTLRCRPGHKFAEYDYSAQEVHIIAALNKDPTLIKYIEDGYDMHRDMASQIFIKDPKEITKRERYNAKNGFVFPTFYGSYYKKTAVEIWNTAEKESIQWLKNQGIKTLDDFTEHMKEIEDAFWYDRFPVAREYKETILLEYENKGYIEMPTGFRCYGPMSRNDILNYPVQGAAFHCLLWTFTQLDRVIKKRKMETTLIGQIHDSTVASVHPEEEEMFDHLVWLYGTQKIREHWDWLIVPLGVEKSISKIDGSWSDVEEIGILSE